MGSCTDPIGATLVETLRDHSRAELGVCMAAADEIERLRAALAGLVQVYVIDGVATTPASEIGDAWAAAQRALRMD